MSFRPIFEGWDVPGRLKRRVRKTFKGIGLNKDVGGAHALAASLSAKLAEQNLDSEHGVVDFCTSIAEAVCLDLGIQTADHPLIDHVARFIDELAYQEGWFALPDLSSEIEFTRSELWELEDQLKRVETLLNHLSDAKALTARFQYPNLARLVPSERLDLMLELRFKKFCFIQLSYQASREFSRA